MKRKSLTRSVKVALAFFWGLYRHAFIRKRASSQTKPSIGLSANKALCWGLYLQKPSIGFICKLVEGSVIIQEGVVVDFSLLRTIRRKGLLGRLDDFVGSFVCRNQLKVTVIKYPTALGALVFFHL